MDAQENTAGVEVKELRPQPVLNIRATIRVDQLGEAMGERVRALSDYVQQHQVPIDGPPYVRYHTFGDIETDMEFGVPVAQPVTGTGTISAGELTGGPAAVTSHLGAHDKLGDAYSRIAAWLKEHGREPAGPAWEIYHWIDLSRADDPSSWDPTAWRTELVQPIK